MNIYKLTVSNRARAESFGLTEHFTVADLADILGTYGHLCLKCGKSGDSVTLSVDHVVPLIRGGTNTKDNIQILCKSCNTGKYDKIEDYRGLAVPVIENKTDYAKHRAKRNLLRVKTIPDAELFPVMLRLPKELHAWIQDRAIKDRRSMNVQITILLEKIKSIEDGDLFTVTQEPPQ